MQFRITLECDSIKLESGAKRDPSLAEETLTRWLELLWYVLQNTVDVHGNRGKNGALGLIKVRSEYS